jgi:hypothetical protein
MMCVLGGGGAVVKLSEMGTAATSGSSQAGDTGFGNETELRKSFPHP